MQLVFIVVAVVLSAVLIFRGALKRKVATDGGARSSPPFFRTPQQHANSSQIYTEQRDVRSKMTRLMRRRRPIWQIRNVHRNIRAYTESLVFLHLIIATSDASSSLLAHLVPRKFLCCRIVLIYHEPLLPKIIYSMKVVPQQHNSNEV